MVLPALNPTTVEALPWASLPPDGTTKSTSFPIYLTASSWLKAGGSPEIFALVVARTPPSIFLQISAKVSLADIRAIF